MSSKTTAWANIMLDHITGRTRAAAVTPVLKLYTVKPGVDGTGGTEVTGGSYAQTAATFGTAAAAGTIANTAAVVFPTATADWGTVVAAGVYDTTAGELLAIIDLPSGGRSVLNGQVLTISIGSLTLSEV